MDLAIIFIAAVTVYNTWQLFKLNSYNENVTTYSIDLLSEQPKKKRGRPRKNVVRY